VTLANAVGDLKKVFSNVKARGGWGEVQLETLLAANKLRSLRSFTHAHPTTSLKMTGACCDSLRTRDPDRLSSEAREWRARQCCKR
jgi:hypothetical protein